MRLVCPNCGAQYEVPDDVIPDSGRDVQCSNCGHTWFENPGASAEAEDEIESVSYSPDDAGTPPLASEPETDDTPAPWADDPDNARLFDQLSPEEQAEALTDKTPAADQPSYDDFDPQDEDDPDPAPPPVAARRQLDPGIAEILREEAEREARQREAEAGSGLESQPDLGLDDTEPMDQAAESRQRMARLTGEDDDTDTRRPAPAVDDRPRRERLPDIEEINSTLVASEEREGPTLQEIAEEKTSRRRGFRRGFSWVVLLAMIAVVTYVYAPVLSARFPAAETSLTAYVELVNDWRIALDIWMQEAASKLNDVTG